MGLTHPDLARPVFHVWNAILAQLAAIRRQEASWGDVVALRYNGRIVDVRWTTSKGWQESIFDDEIVGGCQIYVSRALDEAEEEYLLTAYPGLGPEERSQLVSALRSFRTGEMVPFYIQRYGFYEGHTSYRADPLAIAFIFGLRTLEEIDRSVEGRLDEALTLHYSAAAGG